MRASQRIELVFWDLVVELLSESKTLRAVVGFIARLLEPPEILGMLRVAIFASIFGFCFGVGITFFFDLVLTLR